MLYIYSFFAIVLLIFTNAITDAPNAISTLVGTRVMEFKKAAKLSAIFNFIGLIVMSFINISVANCISSVVDLSDGILGLIGLTSAILVTSIFALISMCFGNPTSETHGLVAGLTGSGIALYGIGAINIKEWRSVIIGLIWSVVGTLIISCIICTVLKKTILKIAEKNIENLQIISTCGMSFMHGAQDGQKFIGILIIFISILKNQKTPEIINPASYIGVILFVAIILFVGVSIGGRKIVEKVGTEMVQLNKREALLSDIATIITLFVASMTGMPVSTTHAKTVSIIGVAKNNNAKTDSKEIYEIIKAWIWTFPICGIGAYLLTVVVKHWVIF